MKKTVKSLLSMSLAAIMLLSLTACGDKKETGSENQEESPEFSYTAEFTKLKGDKYGFMRILGMDSSGMYIHAEEKVGENIPEGMKKEFEGQFDVYESRFLKADFEGNISALPEYKETEPEENSYSGINAVFPQADGNVIIIESVQSSIYKGPEDIKPEDEEYWMYVDNSSKSYIKIIDKNGAELSRNEINLPADSYVDGRSSTATAEGNVIIGSGDHIFGFDSEGKELFDIYAEGNYIDRLIALKDGSILVSYWGDKGPVLCKLDTENKKLGEAVDMPMGAYDIYPGGNGYELCYIDGVNLYGFNIGQEPVKLLNWVDVDINSGNIESFSVNPDGSIVGSSRIPSEGMEGRPETEIFRLSPRAYDPEAQKKEMSIAVMWADQELLNQVIKYNRSNPESRISVKDYSEYNTEDDWQAGQTKLLTEIMSGQMPDMLSLNMLPYTQLAAKGMLVDLYPYLDAEKDMSRDDFFKNLLEAVEVDGKLCQIFPSFNIITAAGAGKVVGEAENWTYKQFNEALSNMPEGCMAFGPYTTKANILSRCLGMDMELYADWSTGKCSFDSPEFVELLNFANQFPMEFDFESYEPGPEDSPMEMISSGRQMLADIYISNVDSVQMDDLQFGGDAVYVGYPSARGGGSIFGVYNSYGISKNCSDKQAAWDFLKSFLKEDYQNKMYFGLPVNRNSFEKKIQEAMTAEYETDAEGNFILDENGEKIEISNHSVSFGSGASFEIYAMTEAQAAKLRNLVETTTKLDDSSSSLMEIVLEEAVPFFKGQKSAEEVARLIQSKVNIYINEQR